MARASDVLKMLLTCLNVKGPYRLRHHQVTNLYTEINTHDKKI